LRSADSGVREIAISNAVGVALADGKANPIEPIKGGGAVETAIASVSAEISPVISVMPAPGPVDNPNGNGGTPIVSVLTVDSPVENGNGNVSLVPPVVPNGNDNGNPVVSVLPVETPVENGNGDVSLALPLIPNGNDTPVVSVMPTGSPVDGALANPNDSGILSAIMSRLPVGK
jgi:hypothetical protein